MHRMSAPEFQVPTSYLLFAAPADHASATIVTAPPSIRPVLPFHPSLLVFIPPLGRRLIDSSSLKTTAVSPWNGARLFCHPSNEDATLPEPATTSNMRPP